MARVGGLAQGDWHEEAEPEGFVGDGMELVDETGDAVKPTAASKSTKVWGPLPAAAAPPAKKAEPYRPGAHLSKKPIDGNFPALGTQVSPPDHSTPAELSSNRFTTLQTEEPVTAPAQPEETKSKKEKKKDWKQGEMKVIVATTQAQQHLVTAEESEEMYKPKIVRGYAERSERRSDFPASESDTIWRKAGGNEPSAPAAFKPAKRPEEPFHRGDDSAPIRRGDDAAPIRREENPTEPLVWRSEAAAQPTKETLATDTASPSKPKFSNSKKRTDEAAPPAAPDTWKAADQQAAAAQTGKAAADQQAAAAQTGKARVNLWARGDPHV